jgi:hypothetical protein
MPYSFEVFLSTLISALNSFSARRAVSMMDFQRFPIGSLTYSVMACFFIDTIFSFRLDKFFFSSPDSRPAGGHPLYILF